MERYEITADGGNGGVAACDQILAGGCRREGVRRQLFHPSRPRVVRIELRPVDRRKGYVV